MLREAYNFILTSPTGSLLLDDGYLGDINNDVSSLYVDYCNGLLFGLPNVQIAKLQRVQNAAARLILGFGKFSHITPALYELHWLPVSLRIDYKILLLTFKCIYGLAPTYLSDLISIKSNSLYNVCVKHG